MNHVTDQRTDRTLDHDLHDWLERSIDELPDGGELPPALRARVLDRLIATPQRRRWWPLRWFPFGIGTTRPAGVDEPRPEGRARNMFTATRVAAGVATLVLVGSLAFVASPVSDQSVAPAAETEAIDPLDFGGFTGQMQCRVGNEGTTTRSDWGTFVEGETYPRCTIETSDPRISGSHYSVHDYYKYRGRPNWGVRSASLVITNDDGAWVTTDGWGYQQPWDGAMFYAQRFEGTGAYDGLTALMIHTQDEWGFDFDVEGVIIPGELPEMPAAPVEAALAAHEERSAASE
jgi:hypothetical protein